MEIPAEVQPVLVILILAILVIVLVTDKLRVSVSFVLAVLALLILGLIRIEDFLTGFSNPSVLTIFLLIFITHAVKEHYNLAGMLDRFFGRARSTRGFLFRMTSSVAAFSSLMNNTPIVALMIPYVRQWAKRKNTPPSKLMLPLSYAALIGGTITVIGTSTNLVLNGFILSRNEDPLQLSHFLFPGILVTAAGILFMYLFADRLLPGRSDAMKELSGHAREYLVETRIGEESELIGQTIAEANLRNLSGAYLFEVIRGRQVYNPVSPGICLEVNDILIFAGETEDIMSLVKDSGNGLQLPHNGRSDPDALANVMETVVPANSELIGKTLKETSFRQRYDAAVIAVHRNGEKIRGKIGEIALKAGDLLLISAGKEFERTIRQNRNLYLVSVIAKVEEVEKKKKWIFGLAFLALAGLMIVGVLDLFMGLLLMLTFAMFTGMLTVADIRRLLELELLIVLVSAIALSKALINSGAAELLADNLLSVFIPYGPRGILIGLFVLTIILTTFVTNVAAVSIVFPITYAICHELGLPHHPFYLGIAFAASACFLSPFSYQTNLMVYGPGGYKFQDYLKVGTPFTFIYAVVSLLFIILYYQI